MNDFFIAALLSVAVGVYAPGERRLVEVQTPQSAAFTVPADRLPTVEKVHDSIVQAAAARSWHIVSEQPGEMILHTEIRGKHRIDVRVSYDRQGVQVAYVSSENMNYHAHRDTAVIHPKYNEWVALLVQDIVAKVTF